MFLEILLIWGSLVTEHRDVKCPAWRGWAGGTVPIPACLCSWGEQHSTRVGKGFVFCNNCLELSQFYEGYSFIIFYNGMRNPELWPSKYQMPLDVVPSCL